MPLIQPASVLLSDQAGISVGRSAATANAPICAQAWLRTSRPQRGSRGRQQAFDDDAVKAAPVEATFPTCPHQLSVLPANRNARSPFYPIARSILLRGGRVPAVKELRSRSDSKLTRAATASAPSAVAGATPSRAISSAAKRTASCVRLARCSPKVALRAAVTRRARSSAASRDAPTIRTSVAGGKRSTKALAAPSRSAAEDDWNVLSMASRS